MDYQDDELNEDNNKVEEESKLKLTRTRGNTCKLSHQAELKEYFTLSLCRGTIIQIYKP